MTLTRVSLRYLWRHRLRTVLCLSLLTLAVAAVTLLVLTSRQLDERMARETAVADAVVAAGTSPTQIVLWSVHGLDIPGESFGWIDYERIARNPAVTRAVPLVLADRFRGYRIVGTTPALLESYRAELRSGRLWHHKSEVVIGADIYDRLKLPLGAILLPSHGLLPQTRERQHPTPYRLVGVLEHTGTYLDRLVLTSPENVWALHAEPLPPEPGEADLVSEPLVAEDLRPIHGIFLDLQPGSSLSSLQASEDFPQHLLLASPAAESWRLFGLGAPGAEIFKGFALILVAVAVLSVVVTLYGGIEARRYDVAVMRTLGASRLQVTMLLLTEGFLLALAGALAGLLLGHVLTTLLGYALAQNQALSITGRRWYPVELWIVAATLGVGIVAALLPAWRARQVDISGTLARG